MPQKNGSEAITQAPIVTTDASAIGLRGVIVAVDPDQAVELGAQVETALTPEDAWESNSDEEGRGN
jgi:hypothetical protein